MDVLLSQAREGWLVVIVCFSSSFSESDINLAHSKYGRLCGKV